MTRQYFSARLQLYPSLQIQGTLDYENKNPEFWLQVYNLKQNIKIKDKEIREDSGEALN